MSELRCYCTECVSPIGNRMRERHWQSDPIESYPPALGDAWLVGQYICYLRENGEATLADALLSVYVQAERRCRELDAETLPAAVGTVAGVITDAECQPDVVIHSLQQPTVGTGGNTHGNEAGSAVSEGHGSERSDDPNPRPTRPD